jgi:hypothetical protein
MKAILAVGGWFALNGCSGDPSIVCALLSSIWGFPVDRGKEFTSVLPCFLELGELGEVTMLGPGGLFGFVRRGLPCGTKCGVGGGLAGVEASVENVSISVQKGRTGDNDVGFAPWHLLAMLCDGNGSMPGGRNWIAAFLPEELVRA